MELKHLFLSLNINLFHFVNNDFLFHKTIILVSYLFSLFFVGFMKLITEQNQLLVAKQSHDISMQGCIAMLAQ